MPVSEDRRIPSGIGMLDSRPQMRVVEGRRIDVFEPRLVDPIPLTISEFTHDALDYLERRSDDTPLVSRIRRGIEAIDVLDQSSFTQKRRVLALFLDQEVEGEDMARELLGLSSQREVGRVIVDAIEDDHVVRQFGLVNYLVLPKILETLKLKKSKITHKQISTEMGLSLINVHDISKRLSLGGLIVPDHPANAQEAEDYRLFCDQVVSLRGNGLSNFEIAAELKTSVNRVSRAVEHLIAIGEVIPIDPNLARSRLPRFKKIAETRGMVFDLRKRRRKIAEISSELSISEREVKNILGHRHDKPRIRQTREVQKELLRGILNKYLLESPGKNISLETVRRSRVIVANASTLKDLYDEISQEQLVPPMRRIKSRKVVPVEIFS